MLELEINIEIRDEKVIIKKLKNKFGAFHQYNMKYEDEYFNKHANVEYFSKTDQVLRLRHSMITSPDTDELIENSYNLTYKGPRIDSIVKSREDKICTISDYQIMKEILLAIGFQPEVSFSLERNKFFLIYNGEKLECFIDTVDKLPNKYFEVKLLREKIEHADQAKQILIGFINELGFINENIIKQSYSESIAEKMEYSSEVNLVHQKDHS